MSRHISNAIFYELWDKIKVGDKFALSSDMYLEIYIWR
jgi:hypothetical protein